MLFQALEWIHDTGEFYLSTHTNVGATLQETEELLKEHNEFKVTAKVRLIPSETRRAQAHDIGRLGALQETREKVKLLLQLADNLVEKGHAHAASIKSWVAAVDKRYKDFASRMEKYRMRLESTLGLSHDSNVSVHHSSLRFGVISAVYMYLIIFFFSSPGSAE